MPREATLPTHATLHGGPCDGQVVEIVGIFYEKCMRRPNRLRSFFMARYLWEEEGDGFIGVFAGYYDRWAGHLRFDKLGRRIGRKKCKS